MEYKESSAADQGSGGGLGAPLCSMPVGSVTASALLWQRVHVTPMTPPVSQSLCVPSQRQVKSRHARVAKEAHGVKRNKD